MRTQRWGAGSGGAGSGAPEEARLYCREHEGLFVSQLNEKAHPRPNPDPSPNPDPDPNPNPDPGPNPYPDPNTNPNPYPNPNNEKDVHSSAIEPLFIGIPHGAPSPNLTLTLTLLGAQA